METSEKYGHNVIEIAYEIEYEDYADWLPCQVVSRTKQSAEEYTYKVIVQMTESESSQVRILLNNVPHSAVRYFDRPYTSDVWPTTAFRHPIHISDDLFPEQWKTLK